MVLLKHATPIQEANPTVTELTYEGNALRYMGVILSDHLQAANKRMTVCWLDLSLSQIWMTRLPAESGVDVLYR